MWLLVELAKQTFVWAYTFFNSFTILPILCMRKGAIETHLVLLPLKDAELGVA
jgi:hypothetical protein